LSAIRTAAAPAQNQTGSTATLVRISGRIIYPSGRPFTSFVSLRPNGEGAGAVRTNAPDMNGRFSFTRCRPAQYLLEVHVGGFQWIRKVIDVRNGKSVDLGTITLQPCPTTGASGYRSPKLPAAGPAIALRPDQVLVLNSRPLELEWMDPFFPRTISRRRINQESSYEPLESCYMIIENASLADRGPWKWAQSLYFPRT
jgi:hypothetical protein